MLLVALIALAGLQAVEANASPATVEFLFTADCPTCGGTSSGPGVFTAISQGGNEYLVTKIQATINGFPVIIAPVGSITLAPATPNDNLVFFPPSSPGNIFSSEGLGMTIDGLANDLACGLTWTGGSGCAVLYPDNNAPNGTVHKAFFTLTETPIPAALPLFATGLGALGLLGWRRKRRATVVNPAQLHRRGETSDELPARVSNM
jgi:hypothetical protein